MCAMNSVLICWIACCFPDLRGNEPLKSLAGCVQATPTAVRELDPSDVAAVVKLLGSASLLTQFVAAVVCEHTAHARSAPHPCARKGVVLVHM